MYCSPRSTNRHAGLYSHTLQQTHTHSHTVTHLMIQSVAALLSTVSVSTCVSTCVQCRMCNYSSLRVVITAADFHKYCVSLYYLIQCLDKKKYWAKVINWTLLGNKTNFQYKSGFCQGAFLCKSNNQNWKRLIQVMKWTHIFKQE